MLLIPQLTSDKVLLLDAFSFDKREIEAVMIVLDSAKAKYDYTSIERDEEGRIGRRYIIEAESATKVQSFLRLRFRKELSRTLDGRVIETGRVISDLKDGEKPFRCEEIDLGGRGKGCKDISAKDKEGAITKCALVLCLVDSDR